MKKLAIFALFIAAGLTACGGNGNDEARLKVLHGSPDAPAVDILVDGNTVVNGLSYSQSTDSLPVDAGSRNIAVNVAGSSTTVIGATLALAENTGYLIVASNRVANIAPIVATIDSVRPAAGKAKVRVLHGAPGAPAVDVYVVAAGDSIATLTPVLSGVPFGAISGYLEVPAGTYDVKVTVAGTKTVAIEALSFSIAEGFLGTVAALDAVGGGAPFSLSVLDERE